MAKTKTVAARKATAKTSSVIDQGRYGSTSFSDPATGRTRATKGSGDAVHLALSLIAFDNLNDVADKNDLQEYDSAKYPNAGMAKMNLGNKLRARVRKGESVVIGDNTVKRLDQQIKMPKPTKPAKAA